MKIVIVGSGNIAHYFGLKLLQSEHTLLQVYSPNIVNAEHLARLLHCDFTNELHQLKEADMYLLAVKDDVVISILQHGLFTDKLWVHTAGSLSINQLLPYVAHVGSIWCLYSIHKKHLPTRTDIPLLINASNTSSLQVVQEIAAYISLTVVPMTDEKKAITHLAAVFANNFSNYVFSIAADIVTKENIPFALLLPLIENTVEKLHFANPEDLQTGPSIRKDTLTIEIHLDYLANNRAYTEIYETFNKLIQEKYASK